MTLLVKVSFAQDSLPEWELQFDNAQTEEEAFSALDHILIAMKEANDSVAWRKKQMATANLLYDTQWGSPVEYLKEVIANIWWEKDKNVAYLYAYLGYYSSIEGEILTSVDAWESVHQLINEGAVETNNYLVSAALKPLGNSYTQLGELQKARLVLEDCYRFYQTNEVEDDAEEMAQVGSDLAILYRTLGDISKAKQQFLEVLELSGIPEETVCLLRINLAETLALLEEPQEAEKQVRTAISLSESNKEIGNRERNLAGAYSILSGILSKQKSLLPALAAMNSAVNYGKSAFPQTYSREMAALFLQRAEIYKLQGNLDKGLVDCQRSLTRLLPGYFISGISSVGNPNRYIPDNRLWETFSLQGSLLDELYQQSRNIEFLTGALNAHEAAMAVEALQLKVFAYDESSLALLAANRSEKSDAVSIAWKLYELSPTRESFFKALSIAERSRSLLLQDRKNQLAMMAGNQVDPLLVREIDKVDSLIAQAQIDLREFDPESMSYLNQEVYLDSLVTKSYGFRDHLLTTSPLYASARFGDLSFDLDGFQASLSGDVLVASYFLGNEEIFVFGISKNKELFFRIPLPEQLNERVNDLSEAITLPYMGRPSSLGMFDSTRRDISQSLYRELIHPLLSLEDFGETNRLWIIPDGIIGRIPFALLLTENPTSPYYADEPFLIKERSLAMASNLTLMYLQLNLDKTQSETELLCVAPSYEMAGMGSARSVGTDIPVAIPEGVRLVFHLQEAEYLNRRYGGGYLHNKEATVPAFMQEASDYSILHFSGHAQPDSSTGLWNFLALEPEAGSLDAFAAFWQPQILALRLNAAMVYLSACETSRGKFYQGEGHSSLARAFLYAGSESVVATLWQIDDSVSLRFSQRFYENLEAGVPKDIAMQQTMVSMIDENRPPYAWSPYLMWGATDPIILRQRNDAWKYLIMGGVAFLVISLLIFGFAQSRRRKRVADTLPS